MAHSICEQLGRFQQHKYVVVFSSYIRDFVIPEGTNTVVYRYDIRNRISTLVLGRDKFLDGLVEKHRVDVVLTIFGPSRWRPRVPHLCGFARAQLLLTDSPYYRHLSLKERAIYRIWAWGFRRSSNFYYTENVYISKLLPNLVGKGKYIYTVTNFYNQIYDQRDQWKNNHILEPYKGCTILTISTNSSHKNLSIMSEICNVMGKKYPNFRFRFVLTINKEQCSWVTDKYKKYFVLLGKVDISECPPLYEQADIMFMPSLLECFTATYPEAMRMEVPIVTTDLDFAHSLCGEAACYYSAVDPEAAAEAIYKVATDKEYARQLTEEGKKQLLKFDNYEQRVEKLIAIMERIASQDNLDNKEEYNKNF